MSSDLELSALIEGLFPEMHRILNLEIYRVSQDGDLGFVIQANFNKIFSIKITDVPNLKFYFQLKLDRAEHLNHGYYNEDYIISLNSDTYVAILAGKIAPMGAFYSKLMTIQKVRE